MEVRLQIARSRGCRPGMTLVELLLGAMMTALVSAAAATLLSGAANASNQSKNARTVTSAGYYLSGRVGAVVRQARSIGQVTAHRISLWVADTNDDDKIQVSETGIIGYDSSGKVVNFTQTTASSTSLVTSAVLQDVTQLNTAITNAGAKTTVWGEDVQACAFDGYPSGSDTKIIRATFTVSTGTDATEFAVTASPKAPADYLYQSGTRTVPSGTETRYTRAKVSPYTGASTAQ